MANLASSIGPKDRLGDIGKKAQSTIGSVLLLRSVTFLLGLGSAVCVLLFVIGLIKNVFFG